MVKAARAIRGVAGMAGRCYRAIPRQGMAMGRALRSPEYWLIVTVCIAGTVGMAWWSAIPAGVAGLAISALPKYVGLWPRARDVGVEGVWWRTVALSTFNSLAAACAAWGVGRMLAWLFW